MGLKSVFPQVYVHFEGTAHNLYHHNYPVNAGGRNEIQSKSFLGTFITKAPGTVRVPRIWDMKILLSIYKIT